MPIWFMTDTWIRIMFLMELLCNWKHDYSKSHEPHVKHHETYTDRPNTTMLTMPKEWIEGQVSLIVSGWARLGSVFQAGGWAVWTGGRRGLQILRLFFGSCISNKWLNDDEHGEHQVFSSLLGFPAVECCGLFQPSPYNGTVHHVYSMTCQGCYCSDAELQELRQLYGVRSGLGLAGKNHKPTSYMYIYNIYI